MVGGKFWRILWRINTHGELVKVADEFFREYGKARLVAMRGKVFVKMFLRFMSTVQHLMEEQKNLKGARRGEETIGGGVNTPTNVTSEIQSKSA